MILSFWGPAYFQGRTGKNFQGVCRMSFSRHLHSLLLFLYFFGGPCLSASSFLDLERFGRIRTQQRKDIIYIYVYIIYLNKHKYIHIDIHIHMYICDRCQCYTMCISMVTCVYSIRMFPPETITVTGVSHFWGLQKEKHWRCFTTSDSQHSTHGFGKKIVFKHSRHHQLSHRIKIIFHTEIGWLQT